MATKDNKTKKRSKASKKASPGGGSNRSKPERKSKRSDREPSDVAPGRSNRVIKSSTRSKKARTQQPPSEKEIVVSLMKKPSAQVVGNFHRDKPISSDQRGNFVKFLNETFATGVSGILDQYQQNLKTFVPPNFSHQAFDQNPTKNRYKDVVCGDAFRVILNDGNPNGSYIHANYFKGDPLVNIFICTQGPMPTTTIDFWRMVVQEKVENIIMLCETVELGRTKCEQYWPREKGEILEFGGIFIKNIDIDTSDTTTILSNLEITIKNESCTVKHYLWRTWPDKSVPQSVMAPFRMLKVARWTGPSIIHCSAGIGRTGTVAILELCLQSILCCKTLSVVQLVQHARTMRAHAIQTDLQLLYVHKCLIAYATAAGLIQGELVEKAAKFETDYNEVLKKNEAVKENYTPLTPTGQGIAPVQIQNVNPGEKQPANVSTATTGQSVTNGPTASAPASPSTTGTTTGIGSTVTAGAGISPNAVTPTGQTSTAPGSTPGSTTPSPTPQNISPVVKQ